MSVRSRLWVLGLLLLGPVAAPRPADAQTTALFVDSQTGDPSGGGRTWSYTTANATFNAERLGSYGTQIRVTTPISTEFWFLSFKSPDPDRHPVVGVYEAARRAPFSTLVGLSVSGHCNQLTGRFVVLEAEYGAGGSVTRFAADFEEHCEDGDEGLFGAVRYNSTVSSLVPFGGAYPIRRFTLTPPVNGSIVGDGLNCGPSSAQCVATVSAPATVSITAVPDPGFVFAGWTGDCSGGPNTTLRIHMPRICSAAFTPFVPVSPRTLVVVTGTSNTLTRGRPIVVSPGNSLVTMSAWQTGFALEFDYVGSSRQSYATFNIGPPTGQTFQIDHTYQASSNADATHAALRVVGDNVICEGGTFTVRDWADGSGGVPSRFAIDFQQVCSGGGLVYGTLLYASSYGGYGRLDVADTALHFTAVQDLLGIVSHSADQAFHVSTSDSTRSWEVKSDQSWLTATSSSGTGPSTVSARVRTGAVATANPATGHLQVFARGIVNVPDPVTVTLDLVPPDTTVRPFAVFRPTGGGWFMPAQPDVQFGLPGDIPLSGDFDGDGTPDLAVYRPSTGEWFTPGRPAQVWSMPGDIPVPADYTGDGITDIAVFRPSASDAQWFILESAPSPLYPAPFFGTRGDVPVPGDYDGDGLADLAVFSPVTGMWSIRRSSTGETVTTQFGLTGDIPLVADFDADRKIDLAVFRPSNGFWYITLSTGGIYSRQFGLPGDIPVPLDVTGDGRAELRVWRPSTGTWYAFDRVLLQASALQYGLPGDMPVMARPELIRARPADLDGDRRADVTIYRPSTGEWFTRQSGTGYGTFTIQQWGLETDVPVPGDYDGDRRANRAVYRPSTGEWFVRRFDGTVLYRQWGLTGDVPVPGDYDGDSRTDMAVYRPSTGEWFILTSASDFGQYWSGQWGLPGDRPMPADFDGDGRTDLAIFRPSTGEWHVTPSTGSAFVEGRPFVGQQQWGLSGDLPIARDFDGDGRADFAVYRPSTGEWYVLGGVSRVAVTRQWGLDGDVPVADDYDGDDVADVAVYRPATREWFVLPSSGAPPFVLQWGLAGDLPVTRR